MMDESRSDVWNYFDRGRKDNKVYAVCNQCNKKLSMITGTTHLQNHLMRCLKRNNQDMSQLLTTKRRKQENPVDEGQERSHQVDLARMIILHGYPLAMVHHLQPLFEAVVPNAIEESCMEIYKREQQTVQHTLNNLNGKISLSVEMWSSGDNDNNYMCLASHYIDEDWRLHRNVLNFITLDPSCTEDMLAEVIIKCLNEWSLETKIFAVTFDDLYVNEESVRLIRDHISKSSQILINGLLFELRSVTHLLNSLVEDCLGAMRDVIKKIRGNVRYVNSSQATRVEFNKIAESAGINSKKILVLDSLVNSNSTYVMLETVLEYKDAFCRLSDYGLYRSLSNTEWEWTLNVAWYLKILLGIASEFSGNKCVTANVYFAEMCYIHIKLIKWCSNNQDNYLSYIARNMKDKFDEYWNKCSLVLAIASVLDPRSKMKIVDYYYNKIYGDMANNRIKEVLNGVKELLDAYSISLAIVAEDHSSSDSDSASASSSGPGLSRAMDTRERWKKFNKSLLEKLEKPNTTTDLDNYLKEPILPNRAEFNILNYWKVHTPRYPILSVMAREVLGTPMSILSPNSTFNSGTPVIAESLSSLSPEIRQALFCAHSWLSTEQKI